MVAAAIARWPSGSSATRTAANGSTTRMCLYISNRSNLDAPTHAAGCTTYTITVSRPQFTI